MQNLYDIEFYFTKQPLHSSARQFVIIYVAVTLLAVASAFGAHYLREFGLLQSNWYSLWQEGGYAEIIQYGLAYNAVVAFLTIGFLRMVPAYGILAAIMAYLLLDDALQIHEKTGYIISVTLSLPSIYGMRPDDLGEIIFLSMMAAGMLCCLAFAFHYARPKHRGDLVIFTSLLMIAGVFGIVVDAIHGNSGNALLGLLEDGGELIVVAAISIFAIERMAKAITPEPHPQAPDKTTP